MLSADTITTAAPAATATEERLDLYREVHKGLRTFLTETLARVGRMDPEDAVDVEPALAQVRELLFICGTHLAHEDAFLHTAMEARSPGSTTAIAREHEGHRRALQRLEVAVAAVAIAAPAARSAAAHDLYRQLAAFVAENLEHMHEEETANNAVLWAGYTDAELHELHGALLQSIPPEEMAVYIRWILPSVTHAERLATLVGMRADAPPEAFDGVLAMARGLLPARDWDKLAAALGVGGPSAVAA